ncbi:hypothetical protein [Sphingomonas immobilis]|uniref:Uncharacterized protein n=1 Tax=Sphingomonas immobilis TaxID=3063997 RepID=A0ABT9A4S9_9SPHN|nr:hypothetical protein [Sphingomonas sp. CA1-15]MDO7844354.1 hypothetical protein [Sphingomonas sp. CA1-15]
MGGVASGAVYLASALTGGGDPATVTPAPPVEPVLVAQDIAHPQTPPVSRPYVIIDVPQSARARPLLGDIVANVIATTVMPGPAAGVAGRLADDVLAEHDARIAVLKQRLEAARAQPGSGASIGELASRLHRAEAARKLAAARAAVDGLCGDRCASGGDVATRKEKIAKPAVAFRQYPRVRFRKSAAAKGVVAVRAPVKIGKARFVVSPQAAVGTGFQVGGRAVAVARGDASRRIAHAKRRQIAAARSLRRPGRVAFDAPTADGLARARHLFAAARRTLGADTHPSRALAGLLHFEGSADWTLATVRRA